LLLDRSLSGFTSSVENDPPGNGVLNKMGCPHVYTAMSAACVKRRLRNTHYNNLKPPGTTLVHEWAYIPGQLGAARVV
jgi:hypothetical protein